MTTPAMITKLWINEFDGNKEIRADFSNERHHAVVIRPPHGTVQLSHALHDLAINIHQDPHLAPNAEVTVRTPNDFEYRRKPRTVNINGLEVPEPMRVAPEIGSVYFVPYISMDEMFDRWPWDGDDQDIFRLNSGVCHTTEEAAVAHSKALLSFTKQGA